MLKHANNSRALISRRSTSCAIVSNRGISRRERCCVKASMRGWGDDDMVVPRPTSVPLITTFFTPDGVVRLRDPIPPRASLPLDAQHTFPSWDEQKLIVGASFLITGRNAIDPSRQIRMSGFCQSVDVLFESVEYIVHANRGEIIEERRLLKSGVHEILKMTVAIPYLWGVPPQLEMLHSAIKEGGGFIDQVNHEWLMQHYQ